MKRVVMCVLAVCVLSTSIAFALLESTVNIPSLTFSATQANCSVRLSYPGDSISATMQLWKGATLVASWTKTGTSSILITGNHSAVSGQTYTLNVVGTAGGKMLNVTPVIKRCP